jgi:tetratricopeptide repeat protein
VSARTRPAALGLAALLAGCAGAGPLPAGEGPSRAARAPLEALVLRNDPAAAAAGIDAALASRADDPWARLGAALLARRALDGPAEVEHLAALVAAAPDHPLALVALRRLGELTEGSPRLAAAVEAAVAPITASGRLRGLAAFRGRVARIAAADARGALDLLARLRGENGAVTAWSMAGPFGALHAFDLLRRFAPEEGTLPAGAPAPLLGAPRPTRPIATPDGVVSLEGEPSDGEAFYLAAELTLARGGRYHAVLGTSSSLRAWLDGAPLAERRAFAGPAPGQLVQPVALAAGRHVLLVKLTRGGARPVLVVSLVRADGAPADVAARPLPPGPLPVAAPGPFPPPAFTPAALAGALEPGGLALSRLLGARDAMTGDLEAAKGLLEEGLARHPGAGPLRAARGLAAAEDPTLDEQIARGRAEAALRSALALDPDDAETRLALAELMRRSDRAADAEPVLAGLPEGAARRPAALAARARVALDRGLAEEAEALGEAAQATGGNCDALKLLADQAGRRDAAAREASLVEELAGCRGGRERWARLLEQRGDAAGLLAALEPLRRTRPLAVAAGLQRAGALAAGGDHAAALAALQPLLAAWPRSAPLQKAAADQAEWAGDLAAARALRERALLSEPGDLTLRRALALADGRELLADVAVDGRAALTAYRAAGVREVAGSALVLDAAAVELHPGGAMTERVHQIIRVLDQEAVDRWGELSAPPGAQVLALRTLKADGRVLEPEGGEGKGTASLAGLEPGDDVELEYLRSTRSAAAREGVAADPFYFATAGVSMFRSTYLVRAPAGLGLEVDAHGLPAPEVRREGPFDVVRVERSGVPAQVPEPEAPAPQEFTPFVHVGAGGGQRAVHLAVADVVVERSAATLEVRALAEEIRAAAGPGASPERLARAAWDEVRARVVGSGGGLGEEASQVLSRGRGSRLTLLKALYDALGVPARVAVARPPLSDQTAGRFAGPGAWSHPLLRLDLPDGPRWLDPALRQQPFGAIGERALDAEALLLPAPGEPPEVARTPAANARPDQRELEVEVALAADGSAEVRGVDRYQGALGAAAKAAFERLDETARRQAVEQLLARAFRGLQLLELAVEGERDPEAPLAIRWRGTVASLAREAGGALVVEAPLMQARLGARHVQLAARRTPLLVESAERAELRLVVRPPPGVEARPGLADQPGPVAWPGAPERLETPFGTFSRRERAEGGALVREERLELHRGRVAPEDYPAFGAFCGAVDAIQARPVVLPR